MSTCFKNELKDKEKELQKLLAISSDKRTILNTLENIRINLSKERIPGSVDILLEYDYKFLSETSFLWPIIKGVANIEEPTIKLPKNNRKFSLKEIIDILHDFFKNSTSKSIYEIFLKIYNENKKSIRFINGDNLSYTGEIIYLEYFKRFYIMGCIENSIEDIMTFAHEFGHAIQFYLNFNNNLYKELNVYIEIVSIFFELICNEHLLSSFYSDAIINAYDTLGKHLDSAKNLDSELILLRAIKSDNIFELRKNIDILLCHLTKEDMNNFMALKPASDYIYVIAFNIATNLFMIYKEDPEYAFYLVNKIISLDLNLSKEDYFKELLSLDVTDIRRPKDYNELILRRVRELK